MDKLKLPFQVVRKLGKDEDEHVIASDSELDAKLELFRSIDDTTCGLQRMIEHYQDRLCSKKLYPYLDCTTVFLAAPASTVP